MCAILWATAPPWWTARRRDHGGYREGVRLLPPGGRGGGASSGTPVAEDLAGGGGGEKWLDFTAADKGKGGAACAGLWGSGRTGAGSGDNYNDVPMLELAGEPWIMEGADPELLRRFPALCPGGGCAGADRAAAGELSGRFLLHMENQEPLRPSEYSRRAQGPESIGDLFFKS